MRYFYLPVLFGVTLAGVVCPMSKVALAAPAHGSMLDRAHAFSPVVIEWFSLSRPRVGQRETVHIRVLNTNKPVSGARFSATLSHGRTLLLRLQGGKTDRRGQASVAFTVPAALAGKTVQVAVAVSYNGHTFPGRNTLKVLK